MKRTTILGICITAFVAIAAWAPNVMAYGTYGSCSGCHGGFLNANYTSNTAQDGVDWVAPILSEAGGVNSLHEGHVAMVDLNCLACHQQEGDNPRIAGPSGDGLNSCMGCHGRNEDANNMGRGPGRGTGLRQHHWVNGVQGTCSGCHPDSNPADFTPVGENVPGARNVVLGVDPCSDVFFGIYGSDNDGDNLYDGNDPDCEAACIETTISESECNGVDDDCDGQIDEDYQATTTFCGDGVCANTGELACQDGQLVDTCAELPPEAADDTTCDGRNEDCEGGIDEDYTPVPTTCGVGECAGNTGTEECLSGTVQDGCDPLAGATAEICDGLDNDCDGETDEGFDADGDGYKTCNGDCNDNNTGINPGAAEICGNGVDENCDGVDDVCSPVDADGDGFSVDEDCNDNNAGINPNAAEICGNGVDENCDGVDDVCPPADADGDGFSVNVDCNDNNAGINPNAVEICGNGIDENCDGVDDECPAEPFCGDGNLDTGEQCDDGNNNNGDDCNSDCTLPVTGGCNEGDLPVITETEYNRGDEKLHLHGQAPGGTTLTVVNADTGETLAAGIRVRGKEWEAEISDVGSSLEHVTIISSNGCAIDLYFGANDDDSSNDVAEENKPGKGNGRGKKEK